MSSHSLIDLNKVNMITSIFKRRHVLHFCTRQFHQVVMSTQIIKPSFPTPTHLKRYNLSLMDQTCPMVYIPFIFHYPNTSGIRDSIVEKSRCLKNSLSETLNQYYPFAGRLDSTRSYVDCNDEGIEFQEVGIECQLSEFIKKPEHEVRDLLYSKNEFSFKQDSPILLVRLNHFQCGGVSILVCLSHKLVDATSFITFMKSWAINTRRISNNVTSNQKLIMEPPHFISHPNESTGTMVLPYITWTTRNFVFPNSKIAKLKAKMKDSYMNATTRVEALTSLLFERAIATASSSGDLTPKALLIPINMRSKLIPPLPETSIGNLFVLTTTIISNNSNENNLKEITEKIKATKVELGGVTKWEDLVTRWAFNESVIPVCEFYCCSSICRMQFYEIDLGWGNPCRVTIADTMGNNTFVLMDTPTGDGIEATVALDEQHMTVFEDDQQILAYTRP